jgi:hypothetical protein
MVGGVKVRRHFEATLLQPCGGIVTIVQQNHFLVTLKICGGNVFAVDLDSSKGSAQIPPAEKHISHNRCPISISIAAVANKSL